MITSQPDRVRFVVGDSSAHVDVLNCERISARRHIHDWLVEPHFQEGLAQVFIFQGGGIDARIDVAPMTLSEDALVWMPPLVSHGFAFPKDAKGWVLTVPSGDVARMTQGRTWLERWIGEPRVLRSSQAPHEIREAACITHWIEVEHAGAGEDRNVVLESLFLLLLSQIGRGLKIAATDGANGPDRLQSLVTRFFPCSTPISIGRAQSLPTRPSCRSRPRTCRAA